MDPRRVTKSYSFFLERDVATKFQVFFKTPIYFNFMWHIVKLDDQCRRYGVKSWRHAWCQTYLKSISGTTHSRTSILVSISWFSRASNPIKFKSSMYNQCVTLYVTSWRHAWRQKYLRSISGTTHCRTSILVSISGFSRTSDPTK